MKICGIFKLDQTFYFSSGIDEQGVMLDNASLK